MHPQLILVEGVPFSGKSTLSDYAALQLRLNGYPARWISEGEMLRRYFRHVLGILEHKHTLSEDALLEDWRTFVQEAMPQPIIFVVDGALSYAGVWPMLAADFPRQVIYTQVERIAEICASMHPRIIHLTGDTASIAEASYVERGQGWIDHIVGQTEEFPYQRARNRSGTAGVAAFFNDAQEFMQVVLEEGGWQHLTLDVTNINRATNQRRLLEFLDISEVDLTHPDLPEVELLGYTGMYVEDSQPESGQSISIQAEEGWLSLHNTTRRIGRLIPESKTRFHVLATMLDVEFQFEDGAVLRLLIFTPDGKIHIYRKQRIDL